jgi:hypothetical protein
VLLFHRVRRDLVFHFLSFSSLLLLQLCLCLPEDANAGQALAFGFALRLRGQDAVAPALGCGLSLRGWISPCARSVLWRTGCSYRHAY